MLTKTRPVLGHPLAAADVATAAQVACLLEASAPKPGNVGPQAAFPDMRYEDFLVSAAAIGPALLGAGERPLGATIRVAIEATARWTRVNTNLGIVLLLVPLARAALAPGDAPLRARLASVLDQTTVDDAVEAYAAIRRAAPGGLGRAPEQDVSGRPTATLRDAMRLAADRDAIAAEYSTGFAITFETGLPALERARDAGLSWSDATVETALAILAAVPDSLIARKLGRPAADAVSRRARSVLDAGGTRTVAGCRGLVELDRWLRDDAHARNPGTTADLTAATLFVGLLGAA